VEPRAGQDERLDALEDLTELADCTGGGAPAVAYDGDGQVLPLGVERVDRVLDHSRVAGVVLRQRDDEPVVATDLLGPGEGAGQAVVAGGGVLGLGEEGQVDLGEVDELDLGGLGGEGGDPLGDLGADAGGARGADDDADLVLTHAPSNT